MSTNRQKKVSNLIQQVLAEVFQKDMPHLFVNSFVGVNYVTISPDLKVASVYITIFKGGEAELDKVNREKSRIRHALAKRIKNQLKYVPELNFYKDDLGEYSDKMNKLIDSLNIKPDADNEDES